MKRSFLVMILFCAAGTAFADDQSFDRVERGRYLSILSDCSACHTAPGGEPFAGGLALTTPFGTIVAPNITPDIETGIGSWSETDFVASLRVGRGHNGIRLYPAMPYPSYTKMSDRDVSDLRAYLQTVSPVKNNVVANQLPFPLNIRLAMVFWNTLNFKEGRYQPNPDKSDEWNRGAYLVQGPGHCGTCHTPKTLLGADKSGSPLEGATLQGWFAPNLTTDDNKGLGKWSKDELVQYLKTGANSSTLASGPMSEAIAHSTSKMTDEDLKSIATYLKDSGIGGSEIKPTPIASTDATMRAGAAIYKDNCAACHRDSGAGDRNLFPTLAGNAVVHSVDTTTLRRVVLEGSRAVATDGAPTGPAMPAFDWRLNDAQIAAVLTYIRNSWGNAAAAVSESDVGSGRRSLAKAP